MLHEELDLLYNNFKKTIRVVSTYNIRYMNTYEKSILHDNDIDEILDKLDKQVNSAPPYISFINKVKHSDKSIMDDLSKKGIVFAEDAKNDFSHCYSYFYLKNETILEPEIHRTVVYTYLYTILDAYLLDCIGIIIKNKTRSIVSSEKTLSYEDILSCNSIDDIYNLISEKELAKLGFESIFDKISFFMDRGITFSDSPDYIFYLIEFNRIRNLLVHNKGIINEQFFQPTKDYSKKYKENTKLYISSINKLKKTYQLDKKIIITDGILTFAIINIQNILEYLNSNIHKKF